MTCERCLSNDVCVRKYDYIQEEWLYGELIAQDYRENIENICGFFKDKSKYIELPCNIEDSEKIKNALENITLYTISPCVECENCPKPKIDEGCCQELRDVYDNKHKQYSSIQDWDFMCENCPLEIEEIGLTKSRYEYALDLRQGKVDFDIKEIPIFLNKKEAEAKLKELNNENE